MQQARNLEAKNAEAQFFNIKKTKNLYRKVFTCIFLSYFFGNKKAGQPAILESGASLYVTYIVEQHMLVPTTLHLLYEQEELNKNLLNIMNIQCCGVQI